MQDNDAQKIAICRRRGGGLGVDLISFLYMLVYNMHLLNVNKSTLIA